MGLTRFRIKISILVAVFMLGYFFVVIGTGTPWGKYVAKQQGEAYLEQRYGSYMVLESMEYDFDDSTYFHQRYHGITHPKIKPSRKVQVYQDIHSGAWKDTYAQSPWQSDITTSIQEKFLSTVHETATVNLNVPTDGQGVEVNLRLDAEYQTDEKLTEFLHQFQREEYPVESLHLYYRDQDFTIPGTWGSRPNAHTSQPS